MYVFQDRLAIEQSKLNSGLWADIEVFRYNWAWHNEELQKLRTRWEWTTMERCTDSSYKSGWAVLMDKGHTGLITTVLVMSFDKKAVSSWLKTAQKQSHMNIPSERVIVENVFGRFCFFILIGSKWRWEKENMSNFYESQLHLLVHTFHGILYVRKTPQCKGLYPTVSFLLESQYKKRTVRKDDWRDCCRLQFSDRVEAKNSNNLALFGDFVGDEDHILAPSNDIGDAL